jgi:Na+/melibiose symporter-like transporter
MGISGLSLPWMHEAEVLPEVDNEHVMEALRNPLLVKALVFVFMVAASPTSGDAYQYFQSDVLHYSPAYISWTVVIFTMANFGAAYAYAAFLRKRNMRLLFRNVIIFVIFVGLFNIMVVERWNLVLGIPDKVFLLGDFVAQGVAGQLIFMPVAVFAARMSPAGGEGFVYALAMSVLNISWACSEFLSGLLAKLFGIESGEYDNLTPLILTVSALTLIPLAFLHFVPELSNLGGEKDEDDGDGLLKNDPESGVHGRDAAYPASLPLLDAEPVEQCEAILQEELTEKSSSCYRPESR